MEEVLKKMSCYVLLTYGTSGPSITHTMCSEIGGFEVRECHTLTQRDLKYTLLNLQTRTSRTAMIRFMTRLDSQIGIKSACIFGYPAVSLGKEIDDHPGMALIIDHVNNKDSQSMEHWLAEGTLRENKQGLLFAHLTGFEVKAMNRAQLLNHVKRLDAKLVEASAKVAEMGTMALELEQIRHENARLKRRCETQLFVFAKAGRLHELPPPSP